MGWNGEIALPGDIAMAANSGAPFDSGFSNLLEDGNDFNSNLGWLFDPVSGNGIAATPNLFVPCNLPDNSNQEDLPAEEESLASLTQQLTRSSGDDALEDMMNPYEGEQPILDLPTIPLSEDGAVSTTLGRWSGMPSAVSCLWSCQS
ncbi:hypothetical protein, variant [Cladophialophora immunda]|uniref:Uncharacterized protein n=1 Tax=Cladophialophora immunda TaxID=569365 RepID=A0A0D2A4T2_9EURO|nr:uncharacterized protein PV07_02056 [Cladophialophora immunda]XP_016255573.1 hypothetical protein, variant [Cladophialophora immunda]KIW35356.1 hypothetical protein PV07_02056 [Cladophialophora immunda]KIW35357.1 hypothetical protein, variant [Cladophialophora immunda]